MFYNNFRVFIWLCIIFGIGKISISPKGIINKPTMIIKIWPLLVVISIIIYFVLTINGFDDFTIRRDLEKISYVNDVVINVFIICANSLNTGNDFKSLYDIINGTLKILKIGDRPILLIYRKINIYISIVAVIYVSLITGEIMNTSLPFTFLIRIPFCLAILHLSAHLYLVLAILKVINQNMTVMFSSKEVTRELMTRRQIFRYIVDPGIKFIKTQHQNDSIDIKFLCKIYDNLCTSVQILHNIHGVQVS